MLIVIGIMVLLISIAIPTFKTLTGGRSLEAAANNVNAILGRARAEAIGQQRVCGVLFVKDPSTERVNCVVVQDAGPAAIPTNNYTPTPNAAFLDLTNPPASLLLPVGVGLQLLDDENRNQTTGAAINDRYIGFNGVHCRLANSQAFNEPLNIYTEANGSHTDSGLQAHIVGAILFDSQGRLVARTYRLKLHTGTAMTALNRLLRDDTDYVDSRTGANVLVEGRPGRGVLDTATGQFTVASECRSSVGLALFDYQTFKESPIIPGQNTRRVYTDEDPQYGGDATNSNISYNVDEQTEENWLDLNALGFYVNRYNGSLVRGE
jgi:type II secretory pathway pseudopilin PulG